MKKAIGILIGGLSLLFFFLRIQAQESPRGYFRFPAIHGENVVFTAEGDLWKVSSKGGNAVRLTSHAAEEIEAAISPDGKWIAFSAGYEGPVEVYVMPVDGGLPKRLTYDGGRTRVVGWTPGGRILYATSRYSTLPDTQLSVVGLDHTISDRIPLNQAAEGCYEPTGKTLFFTRLPFQGSHTRRYRGGTAQNIWKWTEGTPEAIPLTADYAGTSKRPMFWNQRIYFASDRDGVMNLWSMNLQGGDLRQHTRHADFEVQSPSLQGGRIVYQHGADLRLLDLSSDKTVPIPIRLTGDYDQMRERWVGKPVDFLSAVHISPDGDRLVLTARGQVFTAPVKQGRLVEVTRKPSVRYRDAGFLPDGKNLLVLSDESDEVELWKLSANGIGASEQLTRDGTILRWEAVSSPDGKWIAHHDKNNKLWLFDVEKKQNSLIASGTVDGFSDLRWAPDSRHLAFCETAVNQMTVIHIYSLEPKTRAAATSDRYDSYNPIWSSDGQWLYFLSNRTFQTSVGSPWGARQPEPFFDRQTRLYQVALRRGLRSPFQPVDELQPGKTPDKENGKEDSGKKENKPGGVKPIEIETAGLAERLLELPVAAGNYRRLSTDGKRLYWLKYGGASDGRVILESMEIKNDNPKAETFLEDVRRYEMSADAKKLLVAKGDDLYVFPVGAKAPTDLAACKVNLSGWIFSMDPREEWRQMFQEAWRLERDYFYDPAMHGLDWKAVREKYRPLAERVTSRAELNDVLAQMVAELSALHIFVRGGDQRTSPDNIAPASLGARLRRDEAAGGWRVEHIYRSDTDIPQELSPLAKPSSLVQEGEVIEAVNGVATLSVPDVSFLLRNQAGKQVLLRVKASAAGASRDVIVVPISLDREADLRYDEWEYTRRLKTEELGRGDIGYVHLRAMGGGNMTEWMREYYPIFQRKGLIVDVRHNNGGNIDSWLLARLLRRAWFYWQPRSGSAYWNMQYAFRGPMCVLVDERTASDGEAFAEGFRRLGLGKVIGRRTWGGEIWLSSSNFLADRGIATAAEIGVYGPEGEWLIEGHGVDPDIVVDNLPRATFEGADAQLEAAVKHLQQEIQKKPVDVPPPPAYPTKRW